MIAYRRAMTLVETVVAMAVFSIIMLMIYSVFIATTKAFERSNAQVELQADYQFCLDRISGIIKSAAEYTGEKGGQPMGEKPPSGGGFVVKATEDAAPPQNDQLYEIYLDNGVLYIDRTDVSNGTPDSATKETIHRCENVESFSVSFADSGYPDVKVADITIEGSLNGARREVTTSALMRADF